MKMLIKAAMTALCVAITAMAAQAQTLTSDAPDYEPGSTATFTGAGFEPGETVVIQVQHADETPGTGMGHDTWEVVADAFGGFVTTWHVCEDDCANSQLRATADGQTSGRHAECLFYDTVFQLQIVSVTPTVITSLPATITFTILYSSTPTATTIANVRLIDNWGFCVPFVSSPNTTIPSGTGLTATLSVTLTDDAGCIMPCEPYYLDPSVLMRNNALPFPVSRGASFPTQIEINICNTNPAICPPDMVVPTDPGTCTFSGGFGDPGTVYSPAPGTPFAIGTHPITGTGGDGSQCTFNLTVVDQEPPTLDDCAPLVFDADSPVGYFGPIPVPYAVDNCGLASIVNDAPRPLPFGTTMVTWTVLDEAGNPATCVQSMTVNGGSQPPTISCPANLTVGTNDGCAYVAALTPPVVQDETGTASVTNDAPASFPLGVTTVTWTATNAAGQSASCTQTVTVVDDDAPSLACPGDLTFGTNDGCGYSGALAAPDALDACGAVTVTSDAPASFPLGATAVTWTATDAAGNSASCTQTVTVVDDDAPSLACPSDLTLGTNDGCSYSGVLAAPDALDACGAVTVTSDAPASFPLGATTVTWTATDAAGNSASCAQTVTVVDDDAPVVTCPADVEVAVCEPLVLGVADAGDNCDASVVASSNAPATFPIGLTTVTWLATDAAGNSGTCTQQVRVTYGGVEGFLPPMLPSPEVVNIKRGRTLPVKFRLTQCAISTAIAHISVTQMPAGADLEYTEMVVTSTSAADVGTLFRHSGSEGGIYIFNLSTDNLVVGRTYLVRATLADGQAIEGYLKVIR